MIRSSKDTVLFRAKYTLLEEQGPHSQLFAIHVQATSEIKVEIKFCQQRGKNKVLRASERENRKANSQKRLTEN